MFADARGNVVFRLRDEAGQEVGYEVRGTYEKPYHSVHGEKGLFISKVDESPERRVCRIRHRGLKLPRASRYRTHSVDDGQRDREAGDHGATTDGARL